MYLVKLPKNKQKSPLIVVSKWYVSENDSIAKGRPLCVVESPEENIEVASPVDGLVVQIKAVPGQLVDSKAGLLILARQDERKQTDVSKKEDTKQSEVTMSEVTPILMPQAGQSMEEGTILSWKVKEGDTIEVGQIIFEIETDKATMEIEASDAGRIARIVAGEGEIVEVKVPVAYMADSDDDVDAYIKANSAQDSPTPEKDSAEKQEVKTKTAAVQQSVSRTDTGRVKASPAARKIATQKGIDINSVAKGSGPGGRIISCDVENAELSSSDVRTIPVSKMRKAIAGNLSFSKQNIPHFYIKATVEAQKLFDLYKQTKQQFKCSVNDFITLACARAIKQYPAFRSQYSQTGIVEFPTANVGIAVGTDDGLTVPVLVAADRMTLRQVAENTRQIVESARGGKLEGFGQGVFTITNLGMFGTEEFSAIINPPESAILAVGAIREAVVAVGGAIKASRVMTLQLSADHRIIDGVIAAQFMKTLKESLETPSQLL